ncbi:hypothetical protein [Leeuwenhoekiella marinoflava]|uniref:hypothetical protein n=1 Tax=Leeuwenhoekiella marinoflava TaxID=988 RepID=UPI0030023085
MNLQNYGVVELNYEEKMIDGGIFDFGILEAVLTVIAVVEIADAIAEEVVHGWTNPR